MKKISKKLIAMLVCLILVIGAMAVSALAAETIASGECGEFVTWKFTDDGVLTLSGEGEMYDYYGIYEQARPPYIPARYPVPWYDYGDQVKSVVIENGVTRIGDYAFYRCSKMTDVVIPDSVKEVGDFVFNRCAELKSVTLPNDLTELGECVFSDCASLTSVNIPEGITELKYITFYNCASLTSIEIPDSITKIDDSVFEGCTGLTSIIIPASVTGIGRNAFRNCTNLEEIIFLGDAPAFDDYTFSDVATIAAYPIYSDTWTKDVMKNYGGEITWVPYVIAGDVNLDADLTNADLIMMARYIVGLYDAESEEAEIIASIGDMDDDGKVTNADLIALARLIVGIME